MHGIPNSLKLSASDSLPSDLTRSTGRSLPASNAAARIPSVRAVARSSRAQGSDTSAVECTSPTVNSARSRREPDSYVARAAIAVVHAALMPTSTCLSAVVTSRVCGSSMRASNARRSESSSLHSTASAPCAGAGRKSSRISVMSPMRSIRESPATARTVASTSPSRTRRIRVSTFPRMGTTTRSGR